MEHRKVGALMTGADGVVSVREDTRFKDIAALLLEHGISAVPVLDADGRVAGVVSEADLMIKESRAEEPHLANPSSEAQALAAKSAGMTARDVMTSPVVTIGPDSDAVDASRLMEDKGVKRLPVVDDDGRLVGIISRRDVLRVFVRGDEEIREEIREEIMGRLLWLDPDELVVEVGNGVVGLAGEVETRTLAELAGSVIGRVDGVVSVLNGLTYRVDDLPGLEQRFGSVADHAPEA